MQKFISELNRLYLPAGVLSPEALALHLTGQTSDAISLATEDGLTRAMVIAFHKTPDGDEAQHWTQLCAVASALQTQLGFAAPAVSVSGVDGYGLWLSLEAPVPVAQAQEFLELLQAAYFPDMYLRADAASAPVELPPCLHASSGKWAAFIHPGLGASFADESGLEMAPSFTGQAAFLDGLKSISAAQFMNALHSLRGTQDAPSTVAAPAPERLSAADGLLLKDATLEDIVKFLHAKNIEPTFRHLLP
jgi:hypothetical protein